jgi:ATP-dependent RNA helicase DeaD
MLAEKFADISKEDVLKRVAAMEFDRFLKYYENAEDLNLRDKGRREPAERGRDRDRGDRNDRGRSREQSSGNREGRNEYSSGSGYSRLFVNLGTKDGFYKASFLQYILDMSDLKKESLGRIDIKDMNSWIEIDKSAAQQMVRALDGKNYKGRRIRMNDADSGGKR